MVLHHRLPGLSGPVPRAARVCADPLPAIKKRGLRDTLRVHDACLWERRKSRPVRATAVATCVARTTRGVRPMRTFDVDQPAAVDDRAGERRRFTTRWRKARACLCLSAKAAR
jgi:hypothetical protein